MKNTLAFLISIMAISNTSIAQNVGIGENAPATRLDIKGHTTGDLLNIKTSAGTSRLYVKDDGKVGIGTVSPLTTLHVLSPVAATNVVNTEPVFRLQRPTTANVKWDNIAEFRLGTFATNANSQSRLDIWMNNGGNATPGHVVTIEARGRVGIATESPGYPLEVSGGINATITTGRFFTTGIPNLTEMTPFSPQNNIPIAIKANNAIWSTTGFYSSSDKRAKENILLKESVTSLSIINQLKVSQYNWIDNSKKHNQFEDGFIAQEVEKIYPYAINRNKDFIPNIYALAESVNMQEDVIQLTLNEKHDLVKGDLVKIYTEAGKEYRLHVFAVNGKEILLQQGKYKIENATSLFVYGKEVDDFLTVDYDRIFTIGISAIQELSKLVKDLKNENNMLKSDFSLQINALKDELNVMKNQLPQINTVFSYNKPTTK